MVIVPLGANVPSPVNVCTVKPAVAPAGPPELNPTGNLYPVGRDVRELSEPGTLRKRIGIMISPHRKLKLLNWRHLY
jgi:hypothetical protein